MKKVYKFVGLEKIILERLKLNGYNYIFRDDDLNDCLVASRDEPLLDDREEFFIQVNSYYINIGFNIFFDFIKFPKVYKIDDLLSKEFIVYEDY